MEPKQLREILKRHEAWLNNDPSGRRAEFYHVNLVNTNLSDANLRKASFSNALMNGCDLSNTNLEQAGFCNTDLRYSSLNNANLKHATLQRTQLSHAVMDKVNLQNTRIEESALCNAYLEGASLQFAALEGSDFSGASMSSANLSNARLRWVARGNMREIKTAAIDQWLIVYTADRLCIGCQSHPIAKWFSFDDDAIDYMSPVALVWWRKWKPIIQSIIEASPAAPHAGMTTATAKTAQHA